MPKTTAPQSSGKKNKPAPDIKLAVKKPAQKSAQKNAQKGAPAVRENRLELLFTIVNRNKTEYYLDLLQSFDINIQLVILGKGTADAKTLALFGLTDTEKSVIIGVIHQNKIADVMAALDEKFRTIRNGKGIAYTVPMSSVIGTLIFGFLSNNRMAVKDNKEDKQ